MGAPVSRTALGGIFNRKERWSLSGRGWLTLLVAAGVFAYFYTSHIQPFLALTQRVETDTLVVEGWIPEYAIHAAAEEFRNGRYRRVFTTGGPISGSPRITNIYSTSANLGAGRLRTAGVPASMIQMVPSDARDRHRTYYSALALKRWFIKNNLQIKKINVVTVDVHASRSRYLFQKAFGDDVEIGIISIPNPDYDPQRWWSYSAGVKDVITESISWLYVRLFFFPTA